MDYYQTKIAPIAGTTVGDVMNTARRIFRQAVRSGRRRPYIRSAYFGKEKVFLDNFWPHIYQKSFNERPKRLRFMPCAFELVRYSRVLPVITLDSNDSYNILYRFKGKATTGQIFYVQIKEDKKRKQKFLMSVFPE